MSTRSNSVETGAAGHRSVVVGLGATGLSCVRHLMRAGESVVVTDSRSAPPGLAAMSVEFPQVRVVTGGFDPALLEGADRIVVSPGVSDEEPFIDQARARGLEVLGDIELF